MFPLVAFIVSIAAFGNGGAGIFLNMQGNGKIFDVVVTRYHMLAFICSIIILAHTLCMLRFSRTRLTANLVRLRRRATHRSTQKDVVAFVG